jgi:hypothetical protein
MDRKMSRDIWGCHGAGINFQSDPPSDKEGGKMRRTEH